MWALMAQRYLNRHRDYLVSDRVSVLQRVAHDQTRETPLCKLPYHGVWLLKGASHIYTTEAHVQFTASLRRCDGTLVWSGEVNGQWPTHDDVLVSLREVYAKKFGTKVKPIIAPSFHAIRELLKLTPHPKMTRDDEIMDKIDLEE
jgi:probable lipoprotein (TIGR04455 family)